MIDLTTVKWLHIELTSRCNASCIACPRNNDGYGVIPGLQIADLPIPRLTEVLNQLPNLTNVFFCGNFGDCIASKNIDDAIDLVLGKNLMIQIHTNGSLKTTNWWRQLGVKLKDHQHKIIFGIDGLADTHAIYRQNTNFHKIIDNAQAFIDAGGCAEWQFLPFAHNEHQIKDAYKMSKQMGFKNFYLRKNVRYRNVPRHHKTGEPIEIKPWSLEEKFGRHKGKVSNIEDNKNNTLHPENCMHLNLPSVYVNFKGQLITCCFIKNLQITDADIAQEIETGQIREECLIYCGSKK